MNSDTKASQRISKLAPLTEVLGKIDMLAAPVKPREIDLVNARGRVLAADIVASSKLPQQAVALRDGWAVRAEIISDAGPYMPVLLNPKPQWVEVGKPMPAGTDAILTPDAVTMTGQNAEALAPATTGEGVLVAGGDAEAGTILCRAGERMRSVDLAALEEIGVKKVFIREAKILIVRANIKLTDAEDSITPLVARTVEASGGIARIDSKSSLEAALEDKGADAMIVIGGSGAGRSDKSVLTLARMGLVEIHGMGVQPGETAALGTAGSKPVLIIPGRFGAALSVLLIMGTHLFARLSSCSEESLRIPVKLSRKITSQVGIAEFVPVERTKDNAVPLVSSQLSLSTLTRANGWVLVPAESEGYPAGTTIEMRLLP